MAKAAVADYWAEDGDDYGIIRQQQSMPLSAGTRLGAYEIIAPIGAGGMGEVYKARDTRLDRTVAVKVLPDTLASDPQFRDRFDREARAISKLTHPHICTLYDIGEERDKAFLVMEYLEGETLADRLTRGPLKLDEALNVGIQIAEALSTAHRHGIVHRDLKPGNVMLTKHGAKLLDFGLAKTGGLVVVGAVMSKLTTTPPGLTSEGAILGTFPYMAPEQLEGRDADSRSDIFALGALLYEMVTGKAAFEGKSQASLMAAILERQPPPIATVQPLAPAALDRLVSTCLAKDPEGRWQDARDVARQLKWIAGDGTSVAAPRRSATRSRAAEWVAWGVGAAALVVATGASAGYLYRAPPTRRPVWMSIPPPQGKFGQSIGPALSPDGTQIAFAAPDGAGVIRLWIRALDEPFARVLPGTEGLLRASDRPAWSPDGRALAFFAREQLLKIDVAGGAPEVLAGAPNPRGVTWSSAGGILFIPAGGTGIYHISPDGGKPVPLDLVQPGQSATWPEFLPDGRHFIFGTGGNVGDSDSGAYIGQLGSAAVQRVLSFAPPGSRVIYAQGSILFGKAGSLFAQPFDLQQLTITGEAYRVAEPLGSNSASVGDYAFSISGDTLALADTAPQAASSLTWMSRQGRVLGTVGEPAMCQGLAISPDGSRVAQDCLDPKDASYGVWLMEMATGARSLFANDNHNALVPLWAPHGDRLLFRSGTSAVVKGLRSSQSNAVELPRNGGGPWPQDWSPDGKSFLFALEDPTTLYDQWILPMDGHSPPVPYLRTAASEKEARFAPDGHWVAYTSDESGRNEVYIQSFPQTGTKMRISAAGGQSAIWRPDEREIFYVAADRQLMAVSLTVSELSLVPAPAQGLFQLPELVSNPRRRQFGVSPDGQRFLLNAIVPNQKASTLTVVLNWTPSAKK